MEIRKWNYSWIGDEVVLYSLGEIKIGSNTVISQRSYLCTGSHDYTKINFEIFVNQFIYMIHAGLLLMFLFTFRDCVEIVDEVVIGARSSVFKNILEKGCIWAALFQIKYTLILIHEYNNSK